MIEIISGTDLAKVQNRVNSWIASNEVKSITWLQSSYPAHEGVRYTSSERSATVLTAVIEYVDKG